MAQFFNDLFTASATANISTHTSDSSHTWVLAKGTPEPKIFVSGVAGSGGAGMAIIRPSVISPVADAKTTALFHYDTASFSAFGVTVRMGADGNTGYSAVINKASMTWTIVRLTTATTVASYPVLATSAAVTYAQGREVPVELTAEGTGATVTVTLKLDGATALTFSDTDALRTVSAGYPGLLINGSVSSAGAGGWFDTMSADTLTAAAQPDTTLPVMTGTLTSSAVTSSGYTLDWSGTTRSDNVAITGYETSTDGTTWVNAGNVTSKTFTGLAASTSYPNYVRAYDAAGNKSTPALQLSVTTAAPSGDTTAPILTGTITVGTITDTSIAISWPAASDNVAVVSYEASKDGGATWSNIGNVLTYTHTLLTASTSYTLQVRAVDAAGNKSTPALATTATTAVATVVTQPTIPSKLAYSDLVRDVSTSTSATIITLAGTSPSGHRTFAAAYSVGTKNIPVFFGDADHGPNWMVASCTLTASTTLTVDSIYSSSAGGAAPTFGAGNKDVFVTVPAVKVVRKDFIDLADYAVDPTFTTDSTAGIQAAINDAYNFGIGLIRVPTGRYKIAGPRVGSGNCQLYIPQTREAFPSKSIYFEGVSPPNFQQQGLRNVAPPTNGCIFESTLIGAAVSGVNPAVIGGEQGHTDDAWTWNYTNFGMKNMCIRTAVAATGTANKMCALNCYYLSQVNELDMLRIDVNRGLQDMVEPNTGSYGIILPPRDNHLMINIGCIYVSGYNNCVMFQEHTHIRNLISIGNVNGIVLKAAYHGSWVGMYSAEWTRNAIVIEGNHDLTIGMYDAEHNSGTNFSFIQDIKWVSGNRKVSITHCLIVKQSFGQKDDDWTTNATAANYKILVGSGAN